MELELGTRTLKYNSLLNKKYIIKINVVLVIFSRVIAYQTYKNIQ